jgi:hypothetical protein
MGKKKDTFEKWVEDGEADANVGLIQSLAMQGFPEKEIAASIGISDRSLRTLKKKYPAVSSALKNGRCRVVAMLQNHLMDKVSEGDTTAIIYALKVYGGSFFNDRAVIKAEISGSNGGPVDVSMTPTIYLPEKDGHSES